MRVFYKPSDKSVFELNDVCLKMYQRLIRLHQEKPEGLHHILKVLKQLEPAAQEHNDIVAQLIEVNFLRQVQGGIGINTDHLKFINFITKEEHTFVGIFNGFSKLTDVTLITGIQMGIKNTGTNEVSNVQSINPEVIEKRADCCIL